jgi:hypothetical protein
MSHQDGRCATVAETMFVKNSTVTCSSSASSGGTVAKPFCGVQTAIDALTSDKRVIVVRGTSDGFSWANAGGGGQVTVVGQQSALLAAGGSSVGIGLSGGDLFVRDVSISASGAAGVTAQTGATLHLVHSKVLKCSGGGILLAGANFDINDVLVETNGPAYDSPVSWSGIYVKAVPGSGLKRLTNVSAVKNELIGIVCAASVTGESVYASDNTGGDIVTPATCGFSSCTAGAGCGSSLAQ